MSAKSALTLDLFGGNVHAQRMCVMVMDVISTWDDLLDKDVPVSDADLSRAFTTCLVDLPSNPFYRAHHHAVVPLIHTGLTAWMAANLAEGSGDRTRVDAAGTIRQNILGVCMYAITATNPPERAHQVISQVAPLWINELHAEYMLEHGFQPQLAEAE